MNQKKIYQRDLNFTKEPNKNSEIEELNKWNKQWHIKPWKFSRLHEREKCKLEDGNFEKINI